MKIFDKTFAAPEENLACDEALLDSCEANEKDEVLRFWESARHFVVLGYSNKAAHETNLANCSKLKIPIYRRPSGGGAVLQGPGCLNYALILKISKELDTIADTNRYVMEKNRRALEAALRQPVRVRGITDLALGDLKFSGNSQRRKRNYVLFHGTFLLGMDISLVEQALRFPSKVPCYREGRSHKDFVINLEVDSKAIKKALYEEWRAKGKLSSAPDADMKNLIREKYSTQEWNYKF